MIFHFSKFLSLDAPKEVFVLNSWHILYSINTFHGRAMYSIDRRLQFDGSAKLHYPIDCHPLAISRESSDHLQQGDIPVNVIRRWPSLWMMMSGDRAANHRHTQYLFSNYCTRHVSYIYYFWYKTYGNVKLITENKRSLIWQRYRHWWHREFSIGLLTGHQWRQSCPFDNLLFSVMKNIWLRCLF